MLKIFGRLIRNKKGQSLVEYALLIAGVALISAAAVSLFGHKVTHMIAAVAAILPGAHTDDNGPVFVGQLIETTATSPAGIGLDVNAISAGQGTDRLGINVLGPTQGAVNGFDNMIVESN